MGGHLEVLDIHLNKLCGTLPETFSIGSVLRSLDLHDNELEGKIPRSLGNCKELELLDLGYNHLNDTFPMWLETLPKLKVLSLRSNKLLGAIRTLSDENMFSELRIIDLSYNAFTENLSTISTKGLELELDRILTIYVTIDLSSNSFEGYIPSNLGDLIALRGLNLSHNRLQGNIPTSLGNLSFVESLDLSFNQLSREIPQQLDALTFLSFINLSHNHLQGCIPQGHQFATFEKNSYEGNDGLQGFPISKGFGSIWPPETNNADYGEESNSEFMNDFWKATLMGYGSGLCIGLSIIHFMMSTGNLKWLARIIEGLEYKIIMRQRKRH
ncbi:receptor-like protein 9DC3 [Solanum verrucosum]|uniref:receptor-like protein 9DC3 n=1 Tax=Solanum verrucosum TaxID=315347 RepID=UPI0020D147AE|nr:receptor-like protein 9DC3 [Solanum verrucosum]